MFIPKHTLFFVLEMSTLGNVPLVYRPNQQGIFFCPSNYMVGFKNVKNYSSLLWRHLRYEYLCCKYYWHFLFIFLTLLKIISILNLKLDFHVSRLQTINIIIFNNNILNNNIWNCNSISIDFSIKAYHLEGNFFQDFKIVHYLYRSSQRKKRKHENKKIHLYHFDF